MTYFIQTAHLSIYNQVLDICLSLIKSNQQETSCLSQLLHWQIRVVKLLCICVSLIACPESDLSLDVPSLLSRRLAAVQCFLTLICMMRFWLNAVLEWWGCTRKSYLPLHAMVCRESNPVRVWERTNVDAHAFSVCLRVWASQHPSHFLRMSCWVWWKEIIDQRAQAEDRGMKIFWFGA